MSDRFRLNRRNFLHAAVALTGPLSIPQHSLSKAGSPSLTPSEFRERLRGPIVSIPTPFTADFNVDYASLRRLIGRALDHGIAIFELTAGDSQYSFLSYDEIKEVARVVANAVTGKGISIVGTGPWWTDRAIDFARHAELVGGTALQVLIPPGGDDDANVSHYQRISRSTRLPLVLHGNFSTELLNRLMKIDSIVALKEDVSLEYFIETSIHFGSRLNCFSGGSYEWFLVGQPYGATAYFDTYSTFAPEISVRFWRAVQARDLGGERDIVEKYDHPLISHRFSHPFWHASLDYFGVAGRYLRPPQHTYTNEEMKEVKAFYDRIGVYPRGSRS